MDAPPESKSGHLSYKIKFSYGVGHVLNDLCASMWFTYLLIFFHQIIGLDNIMAGNLLLLGQVIDALATPLVGYESDRTKGICGYGKRKSWHLIGCICVAVSFSFIFTPVLGLDDTNTGDLKSSISWASFVYYAPFIVIFQFGWASTQISHLALLPELTHCEHVRVELNSIRYAFTVMSNITVYAAAWILLDRDMRAKKQFGEMLTRSDSITFQTLSYIVIGIGVLFASIFHLGTKETPQNEVNAGVVSSGRRRMGVLCWLKTSQFYVVALLYMCTRLIVNLSQVYLTMYLTETLSLTKTYIAIVPLVVYVSGFLSTFPMKILNKRIGKKKIYVFGLVLVIGTSVFYWFLKQTVYKDSLIMLAAIFGGSGGTIILVMSLSVTADLIDGNTESGAFVYGAMSFTDKLSNGLAVQVIQILHPCKSEACCSLCSPFYRKIMTFVPIGIALLAFIAILLSRKRQTEYMHVNSDETSQLLCNGTTSEGYNSTTQKSGVNVPPSINSNYVSNDIPDDPESTRPAFIVGSTPRTSE